MPIAGPGAGIVGSVLVPAAGLPRIVALAGPCEALLGIATAAACVSPMAMLARITAPCRVELARALPELVRTLEPVSLELRVASEHGLRWLLVSLSARREQEALYIDWIALDLEPQKRRERQLEAQLSRLHLVVSNTSLVVAYLDASGAIRLAEGKGLEALGLSSRQVLDLSFFDLFEDEPGLLEPVRAGLQGTAFRGETRIGERIFECNIDPVLRRAGEVAGLVLVLADITASHRALEAQHRSQQSFRSLIESSPDAVLVHRFGRLVYVNAAVARLLGYEAPKALMGRPLLDLVPAEDRPAIGGHIRAVLGDGAVVTAEHRMTRKDGSPIMLEVRMLPVVFDGELAVVAIGRDLTERKRLQAKLLQTDRLASLGALAAGIGHEINNPLAYMTANLAFVSEELRELLPANDVTEEIVAALSDTRDGAERVRQIVRQLSTFARGDEQLETTAVDVCEVLDSTLRMAWNQLRRKVVVRLFYRANFDVEAVRGRLGQVFLNLIVNAAQAMTEDGGGGRLDISTAREGNETAIRFRDTGPGIAEDTIDKIFDPFFSTKATGKGSGLGLSVCHSIVTDLGGTISAQNGDSGGCTFTVRLPLSTATASERQPPRRILLVEDETWTLQPLQEALRGHDLTIASTSHAALTILASEPPFDLLFCDASVSEVDSGAFEARLAAIAPELENRLVIITSAGSRTAAGRARLELQKPLSVGAVSAVMQREPAR